MRGETQRPGDWRRPAAGGRTRRADWVAWVMYFAVGLVVGAMVGVALVYGKRGRPLVAEQHVLIFVAGAAVLGAGMASLCGDRLMPYKVIPPLPPAHSGVSETCSITAIVTGVVLMLLAVARSFGWV